VSRSAAASFRSVVRSSSTTRRRTWQRSSTPLGAVGGEVVNGLREFARRRRLAIDAVEALVTGELQDGLAYLEVIGESGRPRIRRIAIKVFVASADETATRELFDKMIKRLPLVSTLREALNVDVELVQTP